MKNYFKGLSVDTGFFIVNIILQFLLIPIYLEYISLQELGIWFTMQAIFGFVGLTGLLGGNNYFVKKISSDSIFYSYKSNQYYSNVILFQSIGMFIVLFIGGLVYFNLNKIIDYSINTEYVSLTFLLSLSGFALNFPFSPMVSVFKARHYMVFANTVENLKLFCINIFAVIFMYFDFKLLSFGLAFLSANVLVNIYILIVFKTRFDFSFRFNYVSWNIVKETYTYMKHFILLIFINLLRNSYMPLLIAKFVGPQYVAIFNLSYKIPQTLQGLLSKIGMNLFPFLTKSYEENELIKRKYMIFMKVILRISLFSVITLYFVNEAFVGLWVGSDKFVAPTEHIFLLMTLFIYLISNGIGVFVNASGNFDKLVLVSILDIITALTVTYLLFDKYQFLAIVMGFMFSRLGSFVYIVLKLNRENNILLKDLLISCFRYSIFTNIVTLIALYGLQKYILLLNTWISIILFMLLAFTINLFLYEGIRFMQSDMKNIKKRIIYSIQMEY